MRAVIASFELELKAAKTTSSMQLYVQPIVFILEMKLY